MQTWTPNQPLQNGRFIIQKYLGGGGYGVTYRVIEKHTSKIFAIKTLNSHRQNEPDFQQLQVKFVNEALRLAQCSHPHIVKVHEVIEELGLWGMVMEYVDGVSLWQYVQEGGQLPEDEALRYIDQIGQALEYVHEKGFLHRDVKPENIILRQRTQSAVLIDFGLTREFTVGRTGSMTNAKTEGYAPIEQYERRGNFAPCTDVYALAATLYHLLTAEVPFPANFRKYAQLPPPKQFNPRISDRVNEAILKGMALEAQDRVQTVREFRELLGLAGDHIKLVTTRIDYTQLRDLLAAGKWREADQETLRVMLAVAGTEKSYRLYEEHIDNFPCEDLRTIDQLWAKYSNGRFGFSVQKRIYQSLGGTRQYDRKIWEAFGDAVGWRKGGDWLFGSEMVTFDLNALRGHRPHYSWGGRGLLCSDGEGDRILKEIPWWRKVGVEENKFPNGIDIGPYVVKVRGQLSLVLFSRVEACRL